MATIAFLLVMAVIGVDGRETWDVLDSGLSLQECRQVLAKFPATTVTSPSGVTVILACAVEGVDA